jgi:hypothetical protein
VTTTITMDDTMSHIRADKEDTKQTATTKHEGEEGLLSLWLRRPAHQPGAIGAALLSRTSLPQCLRRKDGTRPERFQAAATTTNTHRRTRSRHQIQRRLHHRSTAPHQHEPRLHHSDAHDHQPNIHKMHTHQNSSRCLIPDTMLLHRCRSHNANQAAEQGFLNGVQKVFLQLIWIKQGINVSRYIYYDKKCEIVFLF